METMEKVELVRKALEDKKAEGLVVLDVRGKSGITDWLVVASATAAPHLRSLGVAVERAVAEGKAGACRKSGDEESAWIVLDLFDVMVHLFLPEARDYYRLEELWS